MIRIAGRATRAWQRTHPKAQITPLGPNLAPERSVTTRPNQPASHVLRRQQKIPGEISRWTVPVAHSSGTTGRKEPFKPEKKRKPLSEALKSSSKNQQAKNGLNAPINIPEDPNGVLTTDHPSAALLTNSSIVVERDIELMSVMIGFEQANKYKVLDPEGSIIGYIVEQDHGFGSTMKRQAFKTHRSFTTFVFDDNMNEVLRLHRPFAWISSRVRVYDPRELATGVSSSDSKALQPAVAQPLDGQKSPQISSLLLSEMRVIGEAQQQWAPFRRKYNLFLYRRTQDDGISSESNSLPASDLSLSKSQQNQFEDSASAEMEFVQFAYVDEPILSWDFSLLSSKSGVLGSVNRNFAGFGREIFTDTGVYALRMDSASISQEAAHRISKTNIQNPLAYDGETLGMTLDQRAVILATAVSIDFDYFSRQTGSDGFLWPYWFPSSSGGGGGGDASPTASDDDDKQGSGGPDVGPNINTPDSGEEVWGETSKPWVSDDPGESVPPPNVGGDGGGDEDGSGVDDFLSVIFDD
ncbi:MAG: hypothetical protein M1814_001426 [Vezdaea aestivalis]|nr:MAG: hypothetical protein M1814_001426 [Vezdaea aestivalis]